MKVVTFEKLPDKYKELLKKAKDAINNSYSPYSNFKVGAAVLSQSGKIYTGTNVENSSYGLTMCAERVAIFKAVSEGERKFEAIAIIGTSNNVVSPCGACRQVILEFSQLSDKKIEVIMSNENMNKVIISTIDEHIPLGFGPLVFKKEQY